MFAKVFYQIFESSIAEDYTVRHIFMDLLVLADLDGVIDKTREAIARVTNVPLDLINRAIDELEKPDPNSRNDADEGRRLLRLDEHRNWGWKIVNYEYYRQMRDEEARRAYFRDRKRQQRARQRNVHNGQTLSNVVLDSPHLSTHAEEDADTEAEEISHESKNLILSAEPPKGKNKSRPESYEELLEFVMDRLHLTENDALALYEHWEGNGYKNNKQAIHNWKATASNWKRRGIFFPSIQSANFGFKK